jgi:hypothetical protein
MHCGINREALESSFVDGIDHQTYLLYLRFLMDSYEYVINPGVRWDMQRWPEVFHTQVENYLNPEFDDLTLESNMSFSQNLSQYRKDP